MSTVGLIVRAKSRIGWHSLKAVRNESKLKVGVVFVSAFLLWLGAYVFFYEGFAWLQGFDTTPTGNFLRLGDILMARVLAVFALALFFMLIFSNTLVVYSTLYKSAEVAWLLHTPVTIRSLFLARFYESVVFSSWASAYLGSPLLLAYGMATGAPWTFYAACILFYVPFVVIPAALGAMITLLLVRALPNLPRGTVFVLVGASIGGVFAYLRGALSYERLADETLLAIVMESTARMQSPLLPSFWAAQGAFAAADGQLISFLYYWGLVLANALMAVLVATEIANLVYYRGWSGLAGLDRTRIKPLGRGILGRLDRWLAVLPNPVRSLVVKDLKLFWRDPTQWAQFVVFFGVMAIYVANLRNRYVDYHGEMYRSWVACLNIGACSLILATLTSRFVFPLISLEGARFWIIGLAPITLRGLIWQKFGLSIASTAPFSIGLVILSSSMLQVEPVRFFLSVYSIVLANFALAGLAVGLGALYPNFQEDNPARIVSGLGGTLNFLFSVGYIGAVVTSQTIIMQWHVLERYTTASAFAWAFGSVLLFITLLSLFCVFAPMMVGYRHLRRAEF